MRYTHCGRSGRNEAPRPHNLYLIIVTNDNSLNIGTQNMKEPYDFDLLKENYELLFEIKCNWILI